MDFFASLFVAKPLNILVVSIVFLCGYFLIQYTALGISRYSRPLLVTSIAWTLYAGWEWLVLLNTPEANIRVDLLVIWPVLAILSVWAFFSLFRH